MTSLGLQLGVVQPLLIVLKEVVVRLRWKSPIYQDRPENRTEGNVEGEVEGSLSKIPAGVPHTNLRVIRVEEGEGEWRNL